jgi:hypothetical protein
MYASGQSGRRGGGSPIPCPYPNNLSPGIVRPSRRSFAGFASSEYRRVLEIVRPNR